jgi:protein-S-isoprenylcysteine O-methyltransferase Ste14
LRLLHKFEAEGNWLFKRRGQLPIFLFILAVPGVFLAHYRSINPLEAKIFSLAGIVISITGTIIRAYIIGTTPKGTSGRNTEEQIAEELNTTGIYSIVRHPLYLGNFFMWMGIVMYTLNPCFVIIVCLLFWIYYERIMFAEEQFLAKKFGQAYQDWSVRTPAFVPKLKGFVSPNERFSFKSVLRREYSGWLAAIVGFVYVDLLRRYSVNLKFSYTKLELALLIAAIVMAIVLRTLKYRTKLLYEQDRS